MSQFRPLEAGWSEQAKKDWDDRARADARYYICTDVALGEEAFYASGRHDYDQFVRPFLGRRGFQLAGKVALEIGCGIGRMTRCFAGDFAKVIGVDSSAEMIQRARASDLARTEFVVGTGRDLAGITDHSVDFVFSYLVLQHVPEIKVILSYLTEAGRVLRPGGLFLLHLNGLPYVYLFGSLWEAYISRSPRLKKLGLQKLPLVRRRALSTWFGHPVLLGDIRLACGAHGLRLLEVRGRWTQSMWVGGVKCMTAANDARHQ